MSDIMDTIRPWGETPCAQCAHYQTEHDSQDPGAHCRARYYHLDSGPYQYLRCDCDGYEPMEARRGAVPES